MTRSLLLIVGLFALSISLTGQSMEKNYRSFEVTRELPFPADEVWANVAEDFGNIANAHPAIWYSGYENGSLAGGLGSERRCDFNESGSRVLYEQITAWNPEDFSFTVRILSAGRFPIDPDNTRAVYSIEPLGADRSRVTFHMDYRTRPAFMGGIAKGRFQRLVGDYLIALEHYMGTGEVVNATTGNFKEIRRQYTSR